MLNGTKFNTALPQSRLALKPLFETTETVETLRKK